MVVNSSCFNSWVKNDHRTLLCAVFFPKVLELFVTDFLDHVESFAYELLLDDFQQFVLLQCFTRHIQRQVIRIHLHQQQNISKTLFHFLIN